MYWIKYMRMKEKWWIQSTKLEIWYSVGILLLVEFFNFMMNWIELTLIHLWMISNYDKMMEWSCTSELNWMMMFEVSMYLHECMSEWYEFDIKVRLWGI